ncbi:hypothetical protein IG631_14778 [Alternaria alternata]|nr:hypothetical protein IG631_14778 [Alternaria alternata]
MGEQSYRTTVAKLHVISDVGKLNITATEESEGDADHASGVTCHRWSFQHQQNTALCISTKYLLVPAFGTCKNAK